MTIGNTEKVFYCSYRNDFTVHKIVQHSHYKQQHYKCISLNDTNIIILSSTKLSL